MQVYITLTPHYILPFIAPTVPFVPQTVSLLLSCCRYIDDPMYL